MIACLPMYDLAPLRAVHDRWWQGIRAHLGYGPDALTRGGDPWGLWRSDDLLLSQTCGLPFRAHLWAHVKLVATPVCDIDAPPGQYFSRIIMRKGAAPQDGLTCAFNEALSQSGWAALHDWLGAQGLTPGAMIASGSHMASARMVLDGEADLAAIDALTWRLLTRYERWTDGLTCVDRTAPTPALPFITAKSRDAEAIYRAMSQALADLTPQDRDALGLRGLIRIDAAAYRAIPIPTPP